MLSFRVLSINANCRERRNPSPSSLPELPAPLSSRSCLAFHFLLCIIVHYDRHTSSHTPASPPLLLGRCSLPSHRPPPLPPLAIMLPLSPRDFSAETTSNITFNKRGKFREKKKEEHTYKSTAHASASRARECHTHETFVLRALCVRYYCMRVRRGMLDAVNTESRMPRRSKYKNYSRLRERAAIRRKNDSLPTERVESTGCPGYARTLSRADSAGSFRCENAIFRSTNFHADDLVLSKYRKTLQNAGPGVCSRILPGGNLERLLDFGHLVLSEYTCWLVLYAN